MIIDFGKTDTPHKPRVVATTESVGKRGEGSPWYS